MGINSFPKPIPTITTVICDMFSSLFLANYIVLLFCNPVHRIDQQCPICLVLMAGVVVAGGNARNFGFAVLYRKHARINRVGLLRLSDDQHLNALSSRIGHMTIQLVFKFKFRRNTLGDRMASVDYKIFDYLKLLVALAATPHVIEIVLRPVGPVVPYRRM